MTAGPALSILVVSFNTREMTLDCLRSVYAETTSPAFEVIVVDNASSDGSAEAITAEFPQATLLALDENLGFGAANNLAARRAHGRRLLLLNPDTVVLDGAITKLWAFAEERPGARIWGGRTLFADRSLNIGSCWGAPTLWSTFCLALGLDHLRPRFGFLRPEALRGWDRDTVREVDIVAGCFLLIDTDLWRELDGFDPLFFMYGEDADLCMRARRAGARPTICPTATIVHYAGASETVRSDKLVRFFTAKAQYARRHWGPLRARLALRLIDTWALGRVVVLGIVGLVRPASRTSHGAWRRTWARRAAWRRAFRETPPARA